LRGHPACDGSPVETGIDPNPSSSPRDEARSPWLDVDPRIPSGPAAVRPQLKAEYMAATDLGPSNMLKGSCKAGAVHTWNWLMRLAIHGLALHEQMRARTIGSRHASTI
jgi:hypothetical protein